MSACPAPLARSPPCYTFPLPLEVAPSSQPIAGVPPLVVLGTREAGHNLAYVVYDICTDSAQEIYTGAMIFSIISKLIVRTFKSENSMEVARLHRIFFRQ